MLFIDTPPHPSDGWATSFLFSGFECLKCSSSSLLNEIIRYVIYVITLDSVFVECWERYSSWIEICLEMLYICCIGFTKLDSNRLLFRYDITGTFPIRVDKVNPSTMLLLDICNNTIFVILRDVIHLYLTRISSISRYRYDFSLSHCVKSWLLWSSQSRTSGSHMWINIPMNGNHQNPHNHQQIQSSQKRNQNHRNLTSSQRNHSSQPLDHQNPSVRQKRPPQ